VQQARAVWRNGGESAVERGKRTDKEVHLENLARVREIVRKNIRQADTAYKTEL